MEKLAGDCNRENCRCSVKMAVGLKPDLRGDKKSRPFPNREGPGGCELIFASRYGVPLGHGSLKLTQFASAGRLRRRPPDQLRSASTRLARALLASCTTGRR